MPYDISRDVQRTGAESARGGPANKSAAVTPSDSVDLADYGCVYLGGAGTIVIIPVDNADGAPITYVAHPIGYMQIRARRVLATGTTATNLVVNFK